MDGRTHRELGDLAGAGARNVPDLNDPIGNVAGRGAGAQAGIGVSIGLSRGAAGGVSRPGARSTEAHIFACVAFHDDPVEFGGEARLQDNRTGFEAKRLARRCGSDAESVRGGPLGAGPGARQRDGRFRHGDGALGAGASAIIDAAMTIAVANQRTSEPASHTSHVGIPATSRSPTAPALQ